MIIYEDVYEHFDDEGDSLVDSCPKQPCPHHNNADEPDEQYLIFTPLNRVLVETELLFDTEQRAAHTAAQCTVVEALDEPLAELSFTLADFQASLSLPEATKEENLWLSQAHDSVYK